MKRLVIVLLAFISAAYGVAALADGMAGRIPHDDRASVDSARLP
jgi:hypothetical protein